MFEKKIRKLPEGTINRIAAGEVVERPFSVVKELVENAIDADANRIDITLGAGGKSLIIVSDNGHGMSSDDMMLAIERHATSKLPEGDGGRSPVSCVHARFSRRGIAFNWGCVENDYYIPTSARSCLLVARTI
jgi:hypothetical protein